MTIELKPELERIIERQLASGQFKSVDEVLTTALAKLPEIPDSEDLDDAVRRVIEFAEKRVVHLPPGERIRDMVHEGHRY